MCVCVCVYVCVCINLYIGMLVENFKIVVTIEERFSKLHVLTTGRLFHVASYSNSHITLRLYTL